MPVLIRFLDPSTTAAPAANSTDLTSRGYPLNTQKASTPQVRGSNSGLGKAESAFYRFSGSINECQACLET
ncbi:hypothetical protein TNCV_212941 [Trichonephila clavipes]|nr:hypothetical protein TNCV_212941 [Trichonephila clavipes]